VFLLLVGNFKRRAPDVATVKGDFVQFGGKDGAVHIDDVRQSPIVDRFSVISNANFGALLADTQFQVVFFCFEGESRQSRHLFAQFLSSTVNCGKPGNRELAGIRSRKSGVHVAFSIEPGAHGDQIGVDVENVSNNLCSGGFVPLALRTTTDGDYNFTIDIELTICSLRVTGKRCARVYDLRLAEIVGSGIECGPDPDSE